MIKTIAAAATPAVPSAVGIVRISGPRAKELMGIVFKPVKSTRQKPRRMTFGWIYARDGTKIDEGLAALMPAPNSYTGEDTAEIYCHGSPGVVAAILDALFYNGAVQALPGEFTRRAFLNGRMDLSQSEAVIDLIESETKFAAANAAAQLGGALGSQLTGIRNEYISIASQLSAVIDFPEEDVPELLMSDIINRLMSCEELLKKLRDSYERGAYIKNGVPCVITGKPNVGKSSLLNAFAGFERAIVTDIPGTTRDVLEQTVTFEGIKFSFFDTAGIRETSDTIERIGVNRAMDAVREAAAVIAVFDSSEPFTSEDEAVISNLPDKKIYCVLNKSDLRHEIDEANLRDRFKFIYEVSAADGSGVDTLLGALAKDFGASSEVAGSLITNPRQQDALVRAMEATKRAISAAKTLTADALCTDIEQAAEIIGEITGQTASEDIINDIFSRFCVGK